MEIIKITRGECVDYAAEELKKYIVALSDGRILPRITANDEGDDDVIRLGLLKDLSLSEEGVEDEMIDDVIDVEVTKLSGYIAGSNPRSILMGVYRYCESAGVRYLRPGENGDYIPSFDLTSHSFKYRKKADYPFRGECCEGAISYEHMRDTVYWLPKIGMNMYMIEGVVPYTYMHKWYGHVYNTKLRIPGQVTDRGMLKKYISRLERDVKRAGLQLHTLGHGWMFEKLGIHHADTKTTKAEEARLTEEEKELFALVGGRRGIYKDSTFFTHLCYSNPKARRMLVDYMVEYAEAKPEVDFIHLWLADSTNNHCECEECKRLEPSDWYVILLNELDEELTRLGSRAKIVFISYVDTVRPPVKMRLKNPERFVLVSAMGSFYEEGYKNEECTEEIPPYERNNFVSFSAPLRMKCHRTWKELSGNIPSFIYEYRYYCDMYCDLSQMRISKETSRDMKALSDVSFNGCISDQTHRMYMPTSLPLITMGNTLFDKTCDFEELKRDYFKSAFGEEGYLVSEFLDELSLCLSPSNFRVGGKGMDEEAGVGFGDSTKKPWINNKYVKERAQRIPALIDGFKPTVIKNIATQEDAARKLSWFYLEKFLPICRLHGEMLEKGAVGDLDGAKAVVGRIRDHLSECEMEIHEVFDLFLYIRAISMKTGYSLPGYYD